MFRKLVPCRIQSDSALRHRQRVTVVDYPDGRLAIRYKGVELAYRTCDSFARSIRAAGVSIGDNPR
jgi:hypothetical protein